LYLLDWHMGYEIIKDKQMIWIWIDHITVHEYAEIFIGRYRWMSIYHFWCVVNEYIKIEPRISQSTKWQL
jgi:hypothetical protein